MLYRTKKGFSHAWPCIMSFVRITSMLAPAIILKSQGIDSGMRRLQFVYSISHSKSDDSRLSSMHWLTEIP